MSLMRFFNTEGPVRPDMHYAFRIPVSDNQAHRPFGSAVAVPAAKAVATVVQCL